MMYESLAEVYDAFAYDFDYEAWADWYSQLIRTKAPDAAEVCDCGCGTGSVTVPLARRGYRMTGIDLSEEMLRKAAEKARRNRQRIPCVHQDMRFLNLTHPVDAIICACDGVNYLTKAEDVLSFFMHANQNLKSGGAFVFDISNEEKLRTMGEVGLYGEDTDDMTYLWQNRYDSDARLIEMDLSFFVKREDGAYRKFCEKHLQRAHLVKEITAALAQAGFGCVDVYGADCGESAGPGGKRIYFAAVKQ